MIDPSDILNKHLSGLKLTAEEIEDIENTFHRFVEITSEAVAGSDVSEDLAQIEAQLKLWKSGAMSATQAALWNAASEYAQAASRIIGKVIQGAIGGLF